MLNSEMTHTVAQGGAAAIAIAFLQQSVTRMIPYSLPALILILLDLLYGVRAARKRGDRVRFSIALKKTMTKTCSYICWIILASTLAVAFEKECIEVIVLGIVFVNELSSIIGNYLETKGLHLSAVNLYRWLFKKGAEKVGVDVTDEEAGSIITEKKLNHVESRLKECGIVVEEEIPVEHET